jgi:two-component system cell cycle sensor histidine kinase/response regulator CckA
MRGSETILLVEDEDAVRSPALEFLTGSGYTVLETGDGAQALEQARHYQARIDLVVTDLAMAGMSGSQLAEALAGLRPDAKVLFVAGFAEHPIGDPGIAGRPTFLRKPFTLRSLAARIREVLAGQAARASSASA